MKKVILTNNWDRLKKISPDLSRIYFGSEFCCSLLPSKEDLRKLVAFRKRTGVDFSIVTPYVSQRGFIKLAGLLSYLDKKLPGSEVIVNDWGVFNMISEKFHNLNMALGRVLSKQKRGFFVPLADKDMPVGSVRIKKAEKEYLRSSILQNRYLMDYVKMKGIRRIGLDNLKQGIIINKEMPCVDLYYPYVYVASSNYCIAASLGEGMKLPISTDRCGKICKIEEKRKSRLCGEDVYWSGNTQFYVNDKLKKADIKKIDRLVDVLL